MKSFRLRAGGELPRLYSCWAQRLLGALGLKSHLPPPQPGLYRTGAQRSLQPSPPLAFGYPKPSSPAEQLTPDPWSWALSLPCLPRHPVLRGSKASDGSWEA